MGSKLSFILLNKTQVEQMTEMLPIGSVGKESACSAGDTGRCEFHSQVWKMPWKRARQSTPVFFPEKSHGQRSLASYSPQGHKESKVTEAIEHAQMPPG